MGIYKDLNVIERGSNVPYTRSIINEDIVLEPHMSGETIFLAITGSTDIAITLPAPQLGLNFQFINTKSPSGTGDAVITSAGGNDTIVTHAVGGTNSAATAKIEGTAALEDENGTVFSVINAADGQTITFTTNSGANYNQAPTKVSTYAWTFGTVGADTAAKATQALHIALEAARADGALKMTLTPASYTSESSFILTQNTDGGVGNTAVVVSAGMSVNDGTLAADGTFTGGSLGADNIGADNVTIEASSLGGEWIDFVSDSNYWYARVTKSDTTAVSMNG
jgi:hypothetical protein